MHHGFDSRDVRAVGTFCFIVAKFILSYPIYRENEIETFNVVYFTYLIHWHMRAVLS